jgi:hypothetical protein
VCLEPGTYSLTGTIALRSGSRTAPAVYRSYDPTNRAVLRWTSSSAYDMLQIPVGGHDVEVDNLVLDGKNVASLGIKCHGSSTSISNHIVARGNTVENVGGGGIGSKYCDYMTVDHNLIYHTGYGVGWSSGVTLNTSYWSDQYTGFHSYITNNVISGTSDESTYHTDGNGIINDLGGNIPPVLVANNVVYENGGRCIHNFHVQHVWVVDNTCYKNGLDSRVASNGEFVEGGSDTADIHSLDNVALAFKGYRYFIPSGAVETYTANDGYGGSVGVAQQFSVDPQFSAAPPVDPTLDQQQASALPPWQLGNALQLGSSSPLLGKGVDPTRDPALNDAMRSDLAAVVAVDQQGAARQSGFWSPGAYAG